jgi:hypothetical protein
VPDPATRVLVAVAVVAAGALVGLLVRRALRRGAAPPAGTVAGATSGLPAGLVVVTAPFCTTCHHLLTVLDRDHPTVPRTVLDVARQPAAAARLGVQAAPTVVAVAADGTEVGRATGVGAVRELAALTALVTPPG